MAVHFIPNFDDVPDWPYPELREVLARFVSAQRIQLADNLVGIYLVGSLAIGDFDPDSDVDFLVITHQEPTPVPQTRVIANCNRLNLSNICATMSAVAYRFNGGSHAMNAEAFRHLYNYHFAENRKIWDEYITLLSQAQFTQQLGYSHGSVRNQIVHLMGVDDAWFRDLSGVAAPDLTPADTDDRTLIRAYGDIVEQNVRAYLENLRDDMLFEHPFAEGEDKALILWQVLIHVVNHGTDHRAQLLRLLNDLGIKTVSQDYVFYAYEHPIE